MIRFLPEMDQCLRPLLWPLFQMETSPCPLCRPLSVPTVEATIPVPTATAELPSPSSFMAQLQGVRPTLEGSPAETAVTASAQVVEPVSAASRRAAAGIYSRYRQPRPVLSSSLRNQAASRREMEGCTFTPRLVSSRAKGGA